jgi:hypothetical protein
MPCLVTLGQWDEAIVAGDTLLARDGALDATYAAAFLAQVADARGDLETLERCRVLAVAHRDSTNVDLGFSAGLVLARCALVSDDPGATLELARPLLAARPPGREMIAEAYELCLEAAMATGDEDVLSALEAQVDALAPNARTPVFRAGQARIIARRLGASRWLARSEQAVA